MGLTDDQKRGYERTIIPGFQEDLTLIEHVSIENIEKILKGRFMNDNIYTAVGPLLFSVNPYRTIIKDEQPIYSEDIARLYYNSSSLELAPHIFMTASDCYKDLRRSGQNQAVIVTGESGSGKTEAAKHIMTFITFVCVDHIELLDSIKRKAFVSTYVESQNIKQTKVVNMLGDLKEEDEGEGSGDAVIDEGERLSVKEQVDLTFESHTSLPHRPTERRSRVVGGGHGISRPSRMTRRDIMMDSNAAVSGSFRDLGTLRSVAQNEADLREVFDAICDQDELLDTVQLKSFGQIEEVLESGDIDESFIDLLVAKFNENAEDDEKDKITFGEFKQVLKLMEEEIMRKEQQQLPPESRRSARPIITSQYSGAFEYSEASIDINRDDGSIDMEDSVNPLQLRSLHDIRSQLLESITVLEAFGNSQTVRNDNSSRFAKYVELQFDETIAKLVGGKISTFLLERSRLVHQVANEYNFHILSYLSRGCNRKDKAKYLLEDPGNYNYLMYDSQHRQSSENPAFTFGLVKDAMLGSGFTLEDLDNVFMLLSGILALGNLEFEEGDDDTVSVCNQRTLDICAQLFEIKSSALNDALVSHKLYQGSTSSLFLSDQDAPTDIRQRRYTCAVKMHDVNYATISRDSLAKELYSRMFKRIVLKMNEKIDNKNFTGKSIGILDICGFEIFDVNRFEQFCINWANEKLHLFFIEQTLRAEKREYESEGVNTSYSDSISDNAKVVSTIEGREGMVALLDDQILLNDYDPDHFIKNMNCLFAGNSNVICPDVFKEMEKKSNVKVYTFGIKHYAGTVNYNAQQFIEKNSDTLYDDLMKVMRNSKNRFIVELCAPTPVDNAKSHGKIPPTIGSQFRKHLQSLVELLRPCNPRYVCCIKPNDEKSAEIVDSNLIKQQIEYLGMTKHIAIRQEGYCFRSLFSEFIRRYRILSTSTWPHWDRDGDEVSYCKDILSQACNTSWHGFILRGRRLKEDGDYTFGQTKVFIKDYKAINSLEKMRGMAIASLVAKVQSVFRMRQERKPYRETRAGVVKIQSVMRCHLRRNHLDYVRQTLSFIQHCARSWLLRQRYNRYNTKVNGKLPRDYVRLVQASYRGLSCRRRLRTDNPELCAKLDPIKSRLDHLNELWRLSFVHLDIVTNLRKEEGCILMRCKLDVAISSMALTSFYIVDNLLHWNVGVVGKNKVGIPLDSSSKIVKGGQSFKPEKLKEVDTGGSSLNSNPFMQAKKKPALPPGSMAAPSTEELDVRALSLGNDIGTSEVVIVCEDEESRDNLFGALLTVIEQTS